MRRRPPPRPMQERHLMAHLRSTVWGPAEFVGLPPWWLAAEALLAGCVGAGAIIGVAVAGAWYGIPGLANGEGGLACAAALALYLCVVRAGRALIAIVALLGACLALQAPHAAAGLVLAERGRVESAVVTSVEGGPGVVTSRGRYFCSVADRDGVPLQVRIWRGCGQSTQPGDAIAVVYDSKGRVPPRGVEDGASRSGPLRDLGGWVAALVVACVIAVVRSYRISHTASDPPVVLSSAAGP
ncbi:hypothetical protein OHA71_07855 [Streptomyces sp. NBC_00444]|uniref:hypothetical protein n=1 Tax=Streptomyces sp. NBC_00444 TaxID=2975744 RepID=UPI002E1E193B